MNKEQFFSACEQIRYGFLTALKLVLILLISPALLFGLFILWIDLIKNDRV